MDAATAKTLAERSGNSFQCKVLNYFRDNGWTVLLSPYYVDASTDKSRESDLIVERRFPVVKHFVGAVNRSVRLRLFIECKYVGAGTVFWMDPMDSQAARNQVFSRPPFSLDHPNYREQHYLQTDDPVAKLFTSEQNKAEDAERDPIFRALNQCLNGFIYNKTRPVMTFSAARNEEITQIDYPVIVCSSFDRFYATNVADPVDPVPIKRNFLVEVDYAYVNHKKGLSRDYFLVDMVDFGNINSFIQSLGIEMAAATYLLEQH